MGYGFYMVRWGGEERPAGYYVLATCDRRGCHTEIDRGLGYLCGDDPHDRDADAPGCGRYYCAAHLGWVGDRGGCQHRRTGRAWGRTLSCMGLANEDGAVCLARAGHIERHAWDVIQDVVLPPFEVPR